MAAPKQESPHHFGRALEPAPNLRSVAANLRSVTRANRVIHQPKTFPVVAAAAGAGGVVGAGAASKPPLLRLDAAGVVAAEVTVGGATATTTTTTSGIAGNAPTGTGAALLLR
mmetsp:Transcript_8860/g.18081  ORF Transcript_8860/g.18081 Transcript_8860/m.18081 type:complete len:113 (+) Transcript_8860:395-733(+)